MKFKWYEIRKSIIKSCVKTFEEQGMVVNKSEIERATDLFDRVVSFPIKYPRVAGLQKELQKALQHSYIDNVGDVGDLKNVLTLQESYLKKILVMAGVKTIQELEHDRPMHKFLLQYTGASETFSKIEETIKESEIGQYDKDATGAYIFSYTYIARLAVHNSPDWDAEDVAQRLRYGITSYIWSTMHLAQKLQNRYPQFKKLVSIDYSEIDDNGYIYDFINYGSSSNQIRGRIVDSYILDFVFKAGGAVQQKELVKAVGVFTKQSLTESAIDGIIGQLVPYKLQYESKSKKTLELKEEECERIRDAYRNYQMLRNRLITDIGDLLDGYGMKGKTQIVYEHLKDLFERNCHSIITMISKENSSKGNNESEEFVNEFKRFLKDNGCPDGKLNEVFESLMRICTMNEVLVNIALGKNFIRMSIPDAFVNELKEWDKLVYLDTQLLLYVLCKYDDFIPFKTSPSFQIVKGLLDAASQNPHIHLVTINEYVSEIAYHMQRALQLVPFDDIYHDCRIQLSNNVFYSYYYYLKENDMLNEGIDSLADFLDEMFGLTYDDLLEGNFDIKYYSYVKELLEEEYGIKVEDAPRFVERELNGSKKIFEMAVMARREENRPDISIRRDAIMGLCLFNNSHNAASQPFFLTWDKSFDNYRKDYMKLNRKQDSIEWHLFSPARFVNHLNLMSMNINVDVITEDLISIIEDKGTSDNCKRVILCMSSIFDKIGIRSRQQKRQYSRIVFNETEFPENTANPEESQLKETEDFNSVFDKIVNLMFTSKYGIKAFENVLSVEFRFTRFVQSVKKRLKTENIDDCANIEFALLEREVEALKGIAVKKTVATTNVEEGGGDAQE